MAAGTLYTYPENFRAYKALVAAQYSSANVKVATNFVFGETNKTEAFLKKFPSGKVPAFETSCGKFLNDSNAIAYYVSNQQLRGNTDFEKSEVLQWLGFADNEILPSACAWVFPILGIMPYNKVSFEKAKEDIKVALNVLNTHLRTKTFLVGERITLADISMACTMLYVYTKVLDPEFRKPFIHVTRWFTTVVNQPQFKAVAGETKLCDKVAEVDPKKFQQQQGKGKDTKKEQKKEEKKEQKKPQPKKEKEPEVELDLADEALAMEPKNKDPFDSLPKGTFNMDDYKRCYSNEDESVSVPYFWEKFDSENYSIWMGEYKYNEELSKAFMSCNLITGMFQRLDKMRKQAFASVCLFGEDNNSTISGIWVWRGQELAFNLCPDWQIDYEVYDWKKLDPSTEETKNLVKQYFSWTGTDKGNRKFNQGKIFK
ncbi:PREDICTED: elongation factor 1-gamma [Nicrophorus vespilloides]|uniref:Elongation factor 1-gamma n=1 Tax=Nicrophorus vespilloides TaxID=110193 RepID=A0ABM1LZX9_NICVS|nr:PREDICTED: elongation factor 1-gamma [Nicrophorus vespilloides]